MDFSMDNVPSTSSVHACKDEELFIFEQILRDSETIPLSLEAFGSIIKKFEKAQSTLPSLHSYSQDALSSAHMWKVNELVEIVPNLIEIYSKELAFKRSSIKDFSSNVNSDLFYAILSSWKHSVYVDFSLLSRLNALIV